MLIGLLVIQYVNCIAFFQVIVFPKPRSIKEKLPVKVAEKVKYSKSGDE